MMRYIVLVLFCLTVVPRVHARVWRVDQATGQFRAIQDAVDLAASGDTITIGPGRYNKAHLVETDGWTEPVRVLVWQEELTIIGSGPDQTIIGPEEPWHLDIGNTRGIVGGDYFGGSRMYVKGIRFENMSHGVYLELTGETVIENCEFFGIHHGMFCYSGSTAVADCMFLMQPRNGFHLYSVSQDLLVTRDCEFELAFDHQWSQSNVVASGTDRVEFTNCTFRNGAGGLSVQGGPSTGFIRDCEFIGQTNTGLNIIPTSGTSAPLVEDCVFLDQYGIALKIRSYGTILNANRLHMERIFGIGIYAIGSLGHITIRDSQLAKGEQYVFLSGEGNPGDPVFFDMRHNSWGTDNPDSISAWILDANDNTEFEEYDAIVEFEPFNSPTGVETDDGLPGSSATLTCYPNPFNPRTTVSFTVPSPGSVQLAVYDLRGRVTRVLLDEYRSAGDHTATWDGRDAEGRRVPSGTYFCRLTAAGENTVSKMVMVQ